MDNLIDWFYGQVVGFLGNFFAEMGNMGVELFDLDWVQANKKHISACITYANIGASAFGVVPKMPLFFQLYMFWTISF